jgi:hypothetical protein
MVERVQKKKLYWYNTLLIRAEYDSHSDLSGKIIGSFHKVAEEDEGRYWNANVQYVYEFKDLFSAKGFYYQFLHKDAFKKDMRYFIIDMFKRLEEDENEDDGD